jgi:hypothetical protein
LYYSARLTRLEKWQEQRFGLRDFWQGLLVSAPFEITAKTLEETWRIVYDLTYESLPPLAILDELSALANFETPHSFLRELAEEYQYQPHSCAFEEVKVRRASFQDAVSVNCLVLKTIDALASKDQAIDVLRMWMRFEDLDYYRITAPGQNGSNVVLFYEVFEAAGVYWSGILEEEPVDFGQVALQPLRWEVALSPLKVLAEQLDTELILTPTRVEVASLGQDTN